METAVNEEIGNLHAKVDIYVLTSIFIMVVIAFRSVLAGIMTVIPLILANLLAFAYMSFANIGFTINTLPCSAVGVGVGVDFSLFIYSRIKEEMGNCSGDWKTAIFTTARTATKGVVFTALSLILPLMAWFFMADLKFQSQMGLLLSLLLGFNMIAALLLQPAVIYIIKPKFLNRENCHIKGGGI